MNLFINDIDFKNAVREEVSKVVCRDSKKDVEQAIQNKLNEFSQVSDEKLFKVIKDRIYSNSAWDGNYLKEKIEECIRQNIEPIFEKSGKEIIENYTRGYLNSYLISTVRKYINESPELQKYITDQLKEAIAKVMVEKFMMK